MSADAGVVERFADAFLGGRLEVLAVLLAEDCRDGNPVPLQPPGRDGVVFKAAAFHARHAGFRTDLTDLCERGDGLVEARWTTRFPDGEVTRWRGRFTVAGEHIAAFEVDHVA